MSRWIVPIVVLPGTVLVFVPTAIVLLTRGTSAAAALPGLSSFPLWIGAAFAFPGLLLSGSAMAMFFRFGEGTPAPWEPPQKLIVQGPYRYVRNPMISGVIALLIAMALILQSWPLGMWAIVFAVGNMVYFPHSEEPALTERFGDDYRLYSQHVRRWWPRVTPWTLASEEQTE